MSTTSDAPVTRVPAERRSDTDWFLENFDQILERYPDEWVAVCEEQIVAHAGSVRELQGQIKALGLKRVFIGRSHPDAWASLK